MSLDLNMEITQAERNALSTIAFVVVYKGKQHAWSHMHTILCMHHGWPFKDSRQLDAVLDTHTVATWMDQDRAEYMLGIDSLTDHRAERQAIVNKWRAKYGAELDVLIDEQRERKARSEVSNG